MRRAGRSGDGDAVSQRVSKPVLSCQNAAIAARASTLAARRPAPALPARVRLCSAASGCKVMISLIWGEMMYRSLGAVALVTIAIAAPVQDAAAHAQDLKSDKRRDAPGKRPGAGSAPHSLITTATTPVVVTRRAGLCALATTEWQLAARCSLF